MSLNTQFLTLWMMFACGCMLGGILDTYRVISGEIRLKRWLIPVFDIAYWLLAMLLVFRVLYWSNLGEVRTFVFLGLLLGVAVYYALLSQFIIRFVRSLIGIIRVCARFAVRLFRAVIIVPLMIIFRSVMAVLMFFGAATIFLLKFMLQLFYPMWKLLQRPLLHVTRATKLDSAARWIRNGVDRIKRRF